MWIFSFAHKLALRAKTVFFQPKITRLPSILLRKHNKRYLKYCFKLIRWNPPFHNPFQFQFLHPPLIISMSHHQKISSFYIFDVGEKKLEKYTEIETKVSEHTKKLDWFSFLSFCFAFTKR